MTQFLLLFSSHPFTWEEGEIRDGGIHHWHLDSEGQGFR